MSHQEFLDMFNTHQEIRGFFSVQGLDINDAEMFFMMLKDAEHGEDSVEIDAFVDGCMKMKGVAKSLDVQYLRFRLMQMRKNEVTFFKEMSRQTELLKAQ